MCNAWNHPPGCNCGWGGGNHGGGGGLGGLNISLPPPSPADVAIGKQPKLIREAKTYSTTCWWCGDPVFYHTNGHGDCVLFDTLGHPWQVHECWTDYWEGQKALRKGLIDETVVSDIIYSAEQFEQSGQPSTYKALGAQPSKPQCGEQRLAILAGAISRTNFIPDEFTVASFLGLTVEQLQSGYGDLYTINDSTNGIQLLPITQIPSTPGKAKPATPTKRPEIVEHRKPKPSKKKSKKHKGKGR